MMSVLLLTFTVSTGFVSNAYQKAYAAEDFSTSDLSPKIREWINNQMREELFTPSSSSGPIQQIHSIKLTLSGFPHQTGESVTNIDLRPSPCRVQIDITCTGLSNIVIPGIGEGSASVFFAFPLSQQGQTHLLSAVIALVITVAGFSIPVIINSIAAAIFGDNGRVQQLNGDIINNIINGNAVTFTIHIPGIGSGQATVQLS
jgi:hypothetical protein